ncbi:Molybdenum-pterin-binding protein MopA [Candidatus Defluviicoccus seviourii]|uniref:Molybdenum-pterin-binding protein MopA n=1 Tax=Candidatus Defluviicoccus seviourii TaxID=2565273 RepID=A0A564WBM2_9PROT|nr:Molybdenum-pterin-binding protein MopA [Candidatus Defluviicoccus seviourii]
MSIAKMEPVIGLRSKTGKRIGDDRIRLLEAVDQLGSISGAARAVGLTYKAAWDAIAALNNLAEHPLVVARTGGRVGGGAVLTEDGRRLLASMRWLQAELQRLSAASAARHDQQNLAGRDGFAPVLSWRFVMKTSARNMLRCKVVEVSRGPVSAEVILSIADGIRLVAIITGESVASLGLEPGKEVFALIKSTFVLLAPEGETGRTSARNVVPGTVIRHVEGAVNSEIVLDIGGGKTIAAIITKESAETLGFKVGDRACALIKASHIILAVE